MFAFVALLLVHIPLAANAEDPELKERTEAFAPPTSVESAEISKKTINDIKWLRDSRRSQMMGLSVLISTATFVPIVTLVLGTHMLAPEFFSKHSGVFITSGVVAATGYLLSFVVPFAAPIYPWYRRRVVRRLEENLGHPERLSKRARRIIKREATSPWLESPDLVVCQSKMRSIAK